MRFNSQLRNTVIVTGLLAVLAMLPMAQAVAQAATDTGVQDTTSDNQTVADEAADTWITTKVKSKLAAAKYIKASDISVRTHDGVVILSGTVATPRERIRAERIARRVKGVKSVEASRLTVNKEAAE